MIGKFVVNLLFLGQGHDPGVATAAHQKVSIEDGGPAPARGHVQGKEMLQGRNLQMICG